MTVKPDQAMPIAVLASGRGSNLQAILEHVEAGRLAARVAIVVSDLHDAPALRRARDAAIPAQVVSPADFPDRDAWTEGLAQVLQRSGVQLVVLAGFMRVIGPRLLDRFPGRALNIHPSLLPRYPGLDTYRRVLAAGDTEHGTSVHFVTPELDGGPVIAQVRLAISDTDDETTLLRKVQRQEHWLYPKVIGWFVNGRLEMRENSAWLDGKKLEQPVRLPAIQPTTAGTVFA